MAEMYQILAPDGRIVNQPAFQELGLNAEDYIKIYEYMSLTRLFEKRAVDEAMFKDHMPLYISPKGQEAAEVASAYALGPEDWIFWYTRSQGAAFDRKVSLESIWKIFHGIPDPQLIEDLLSHKSMIPYVLVGIHLTHAVGFAWAQMLKRGKPEVVSVAYFGDGATSRPDFHSAMNFAGIHKIPTIFICENNHWAISTPNVKQTATKTFAEKAAAYGIASEYVDGNDPLAVYAATKRALARARSGAGATLIEAVTYRADPHTTAVGEIKKIPEEIMQDAEAKDPLKRMFAFLVSEEARGLGIDWNKEKDLQRLSEIKALVKGTAAKSFSLLSEVDENVVAENARKLLEEIRIGKNYRDFSNISFFPEEIPGATPRDAINFGHFDAMMHDPDVIVMGEDVGDIGSVNRTVALPEKFVTEYLPEYADKILIKHLPLIAHEKIGPNRAIDTPVDEWGIMGHAIGLALGGLRPIVEVQYSGFVFGMGDHIFVELPRLMHRSGGKLNMPVVVRLPYGAGRFIESHREFEVPQFLNLPGLIIVCPSTVQDFYDMFWAAVASDKPVLFFEDKIIYRGELEFNYSYKYIDLNGTEQEKKIEKKKVEIKNNLIRRPPFQPVENFGIRVARKGADVTLTAYGRLVYACLEAAEILQEENISAEVLDIRVFKPFDQKTLISSVKKTGALVIVQEEPIFGGTGAEIAALVYETAESFHYLKSPLVRLGPKTYQTTHVDYRSHVPQPPEIVMAVKKALSKIL